MDALHAYALLKDACRALDETGDHAAAAYVGQAMSLLEHKYDIDPDAVASDAVAQMPPPAKPHDFGSNWA